MGRCNDQHHLIAPHVSAQRCHRARGNGDSSSAALCGLADTHLPDQQDAVAAFKATSNGGNHMLLRGVKRVFAFKLDRVEKAL